LQTDRFFSSIKGQGGSVRLVLLPLESDGRWPRIRPPYVLGDE
jgi:hypothetical protein